MYVYKFWIVFVCFFFKIEFIRVVFSDIYMVVVNISKDVGNIYYYVFKYVLEC